MLHNEIPTSRFVTILSVSKNCSVVFAEQCRPLTLFQRKAIEAIITEYSNFIGQLDSIEISMELFIRTGLYSTIRFRSIENNFVEVLLWFSQQKTLYYKNKV